METPAVESQTSSPAVVATKDATSSQAGGKRSAWIAHIKRVAKAKGIKYGDAMKIASKTFKGGGGDLLGKGVPMGGKRRGTKKAGKRRGGALYGFGGDLADGGMRYGTEGDASWTPPGGSSLTGTTGAPPAKSGGRRRNTRRRRSTRRR
jgi:hypothetical protein